MMTEQLKRDGNRVAEIFMDHMPKDVRKQYNKWPNKVRLSYFFCWCIQMQDLFDMDDDKRRPDLN